MTDKELEYISPHTDTPLDNYVRVGEPIHRFDLFELVQTAKQNAIPYTFRTDLNPPPSVNIIDDLNHMDKWGEVIEVDGKLFWGNSRTPFKQPISALVQSLIDEKEKMKSMTLEELQEDARSGHEQHRP